jgi:hypothetical protein
MTQFYGMELFVCADTMGEKHHIRGTARVSAFMVVVSVDCVCHCVCLEKITTRIFFNNGNGIHQITVNLGYKDLRYKNTRL